MTGDRKIRIFIDAHSFDKEHQGIRSYIKRLYTELSQRSDRYIFYFGARNISQLAIELSAIRNAHFLRYRFSSTLLRLCFEVPLLIRKHRIDFAHFQYIAPFFPGTRTIVTTHDVLFLDFKTYFPPLYRVSRAPLFAHSLRQATIKSTVSEYSRARLAHHFSVNPAEILVMPSGVGDDYFKNFDRSLSQDYVTSKYGAGKYILYVSRFEPRKNHVRLLEEYLALRLYETGVDLVFVGHKSLPVKSFDMALQNAPTEVRKNIFIIEAASDTDLYHLYRGTSLFVYPSFAEGFGLPPIEAAALKIPVICSNATAMSDYDFFGENQVSPADNELLRERIRLNLEQNSGNTAGLTKISEEIARRYNFRRSAEVLEKAISGILGK